MQLCSTWSNPTCIYTWAILIYLNVSENLQGLNEANSYLASFHCRHKASLQWDRSSRGRGCHSCFCSRGCHRPRLSSTCHIHSTVCWRQSFQVCTSHDQSSYWDKSWPWAERHFHFQSSFAADMWKKTSCHRSTATRYKVNWKPFHCSSE